MKTKKLPIFTKDPETGGPSPIGVRTSSTAVDVESAPLVITGMPSFDMSMLPPERQVSEQVSK